MILSGLEIKKQLGKNIFIEPYDPSALNTNSYNVKLHNKLLRYTQPTLDMRQPNAYEEIEIPPEGYVLQPGELYLGRTLEHTKTLGYVPMIEGRSSIGRLGIFVHVTAGFGDIGFTGYWTLEILTVKPVRVYAGVEIAQLYYHTVQGEYESYSSSKYQNNTSVQPSMLYKDFEKK